MHVAAFVALTSVATTWLFLSPPTRGAAAWASALASVAQVALFTWALGAALRVATVRRLDAIAYALAATLLATYLTLDRIAFDVTGAHLRPGTIRQAVEAVRAGALRLGSDRIAGAAAATLLVWLLLSALVKALAWLPARAGLDDAVRRAGVPVLLAAGILGPLRDWWEPAPQAEVHAAANAEDRTGALLGEERVFALLKERREAVLGHPIHAASRPDILVVHVESLRADMLRPDVAPSMVALSKEAITPAHHLTTGTNTGTGVFGLLYGLPSPYYPLARRAHTRPLPLEILAALGYRTSVYFANNFRVYDGLYDLFFGGLAAYTYSGPEDPVYAADAQMVDAYLATLHGQPAGAAPRFDYVILDSTHYDYSYPPSFERFTPAMTLDLGVRDGTVIRDGINDAMRPRGPFVRNRYQNSILYADSLVQRILDALRREGRLEHTLVVVVGDHGEEFWESGAFGHGYGHLSRQQCEAPLLLRIPGGPTTTRYTYTSHADVFPTLFDAMGLETVGGAFMSGKSLLRFDPALDVAVAGFGVTGDKVDDRFIVEGDGLVVHWIDAPPFAVTGITALDGSPLTDVPPERADDLVFRAIAAKGLR